MKGLLTALSSLLLVTPALAQDLSYNFAQLGYQNVDLDAGPVDVDGDGFVLGGSAAITEQFHLFVGYGMADFDFDVELTELSLGLGFNTPIADNSDFVASIGYVEAEVDTGLFGSADESGYGVSIGLRSMIAPQFELDGSINYVDLGDGDDTSVDAAGWYYFNDNVAGGVGLGFSDDVTNYGIFVRVFFDR